jgi:hypothetical protein
MPTLKRKQGDQIVRIFAYWAIVIFGSFLLLQMYVAGSFSLVKGM